MGQSSSTEQKKYNNFYHICNIIPDIPQSNHKIWECNNDDLEIPKILDRRYDLDLSPSMLNMDLKFNGAYMIASCIYNILSLQYGYKHMLSIQMIYWQSVREFFQLQSIDSSMNYKLSISSILNIIKNMYICSEKEFSIYNDQNISDNILIDNHQKPFFNMEYYYIPNQEKILKNILFNDNLILANIVLFSTFLECEDGIIHPPGEDDQSAGMIVVTIVGYQENIWIAKFPFGVHWGDNGYGYISFDYFNRYNRDRWLININSCSSPPSLKHSSEILSAEMPNQNECNTLYKKYNKVTSKHQNSNNIRRRTFA